MIMEKINITDIWQGIAVERLITLVVTCEVWQCIR